MMQRDSENLISEEPNQIELISKYWDKHPFEYQLSESHIGTVDYFHQVEFYYSTKYSYKSKYFDYGSLKGKRGLDIGCGFGNDLVILAKAGALVTGVDLSDVAVQMSKRHLEMHNLNAEVLKENGEDLKFDDNSFDFIFAISTLCYTLDPEKMLREIHRVLKEDGQAYFTVYNTNSWLNFLLKALNKKSQRHNAPGFHQYTVVEFEELLKNFSRVEISTDRFPYKTDRDNKIQTALYNKLFVPAFGFIPKKLVKSYGHHIIAKVVK